MHDFAQLRNLWLGADVDDEPISPEWPKEGVAIEGDFSGIQRFVLRPVPGASGAASRLRARSFRVLALTRLIAEAVEARFRDAAAKLFYSAGGRFLIVCGPCADWPQRLEQIQRELDLELLDSYLGELIFHIAGAEFADGKIPVEDLGRAMGKRKKTPLWGSLQALGSWAKPHRFFTRATKHEKCNGCGATAIVSTGPEALCSTCGDDRELGRDLLKSVRVAVSRSNTGTIAVLGSRWSFSADGEIPISSIALAPSQGGRIATFEDLAAQGAGRRYLAYLRVDADRVGEKFRDLAGQPQRVWALSRLLDGAFSSVVSHLIASGFTNLYPVYGGGDDLFVVGPWDKVLHFAAELRLRFQELSGGALTFSAGLALAKPRQHILTKSEEAEQMLNESAKLQRDSICALGCTITWTDFPHVLNGAKRMASLAAAGQFRSAFLHDLMEFHDLWRREDARWHSRLFYQAQRNLTGPARDFVSQEFLASGRLWPNASFLVRYTMLSTSAGEGN